MVNTLWTWEKKNSSESVDSGRSMGSCSSWIRPLMRRGRRDRRIPLTASLEVSSVHPVAARRSVLTKRGDRAHARVVWNDCHRLLASRGVFRMSEWRERYGDDMRSEVGLLTAASDPKCLLELALETLMPSLEMISLKKAGAVYQVPRAVKTARGRTMALRWLMEAATSQLRGSNPMYYRLGHARAAEILLRLEDRLSRASSSASGADVPAALKSASLPKKLALYRTAVTNRHYVSAMQESSEE